MSRHLDKYRVTAADLDSVLREHSRLMYYGFAYEDLEDFKNKTNEEKRQLIKKSQDYLRANLELLSRVKTVLSVVAPAHRVDRTNFSSYSLKHIVEKILGTYVSNGQLIAAALCLGFRAVPLGPNAVFNMRQKDMSFLRDVSCFVDCLRQEGAIAWPGQGERLYKREAA